MTQAEAEAVASWHYAPPFDFYDWTADGDDLDLLLSPERREGRFFSVHDGGELAGFFEYRREGDEVVVGLGLRPELTGHGLGVRFVEAGLLFGRERLGAQAFRLTVAEFNRRARLVYERCGFSETRTFDHETNGGVWRFVEMVRPASDRP